MDKDTKKQKKDRVPLLESFIKEIEANGQWRKYLNPRSEELHIAEVCREMGHREGNDIPWDSTFFRGRNWGVPHKDAFNKWVRERLRTELDTRDGLEVSLESSIVLPKWLKPDGLTDDMMEFIRDLQGKLSREKEIRAVLEANLRSKDRKLGELQTKMDSMSELYRIHDVHYMMSIRNLAYD